MDAERSVAIVIPALDEMANLRKLLPATVDALAGIPGARGTIHVIVGRSTTDADLDTLRSLGATPVRRSPADTFGDAVRTGIAACAPDTDLVVFMDADGSHDPATIPRLVARADEADVVVASRYVAGGRSDNGLALRAMSRSLNLAYGVVLGLRCRDLSTSYKLFRYSDVSAVDLTCHNFDIVEELLFRVSRRVGQGIRIVEVPDYFHERDEGQTKRQLGPFVASYLVTLMRLRIKG